MLNVAALHCVTLRGWSYTEAIASLRVECEQFPAVLDWIVDNFR